MGLAHRLAYRALRPLLFSLDAERAHDLVMSGLANAFPFTRRLISLERIDDPVTVAGLSFPNQVGLAAGLDKEARCLTALASLGFGFIEAGSVAPCGEVWAEPPRIHRLPQAQALINRIGLHRDGLEAFCSALSHCPWPLDPRSSVPVRLGVNLACNAATHESEAIGDYSAGLKATMTVASFRPEIGCRAGSRGTRAARRPCSATEFADATIGAVALEDASKPLPRQMVHQLREHQLACIHGRRSGCKIPQLRPVRRSSR